MKVKEQFIDTETLMAAKDSHELLKILYQLSDAFAIRNGCPASHIFLSIPVQHRLLHLCTHYIRGVCINQEAENKIMGLTIMTSPNDKNFIALL